MRMGQTIRQIAEATPPERNRAVDFFRAVAILMVMLGHWLVAAPYYVDGQLESSKILAIQPWTQFLTWPFQVMPVFFMVGGFSNAASWLSASRDTAKRAGWVATRMNRLLFPILPLVVFWMIFSLVWRVAGFDPTLARIATQAGMVPTWFLAVYALVAGLTPLSHWLWRRIGLLSLAPMVLAAASVDIIAFNTDADWLRWVNYAFIWLAVHQLGFWWHRGEIRRYEPLVLIAFGAATLWLLIGRFDYPISMISVPGAEVSNSSPPTFALLGIATIQAGLLLLIAKPVSRWLEAPRRWALVILASFRMMTLYLWHTTALVALVGGAILLDGYGLQTPPGTADWWLTRPIWIAIAAAAMIIFVVAFGWAESAGRRMNGHPAAPARAFFGAAVASLGIAQLSLHGTAADTLTGLNFVPVVAALVGISLATFSRPG